MRGLLLLVLATGHAVGGTSLFAKEGNKIFDAEKDLISLHYDHAPDKDDGHSAAADRTLLQQVFGREWLPQHVVAVSGAYGTNAKAFNPRSNLVMDACWNDVGGWLDAHTQREEAIRALADRWRKTIESGGDVWIKEGGQSDLTADVVRHLVQIAPDIKTTERIHTVQHSDWNEEKTTASDLAYAKEATDYVRIQDANRYLNRKGGNAAFQTAATTHPQFGAMWRAAFSYYDPQHRLDFSDTGELMAILDLGEVGIESFHQRYLN